jgi:hypothetical protein
MEIAAFFQRAIALGAVSVRPRADGIAWAAPERGAHSWQAERLRAARRGQDREMVDDLGLRQQGSSPFAPDLTGYGRGAIGTSRCSAM